MRPVSAPSRIPVLLLHGLWMGRPAMLWWFSKLRAAGYAPVIHGYRTLRADPQRIVDDLAARWSAFDSAPVHALGHSLGGLTLLAALQRYPELPEGRLLCLGSPLNGSAVAAHLAQRRGLRWAVGSAAKRLQEAAQIPVGREVAMIAGDRAVGVGQWLGRLPAPHDGSVAVAETRHPGLVDHRVIHASHSGLICSSPALDLALRFYANGRFNLDSSVDRSMRSIEL